MMGNELKPCPFCGGDTRMLTASEQIDEAFTEIMCCQCGMIFKYTQHFAWSKDARIKLSESFKDVWNRRVPDQKVSVALYDQEEIHHNCTVQILSNSVTGDVSIGWWPEGKYPYGTE